MNSNSTGVKRLDRIVAIRETLASAAEARLREAEMKVREIESQDNHIVRHIQDIRAEISQPRGLTGQQIQQNEKYIYRLNQQRTLVLQALENAKKVVLERQQDWIEARREQKIVDRLQEKRLLEWRRLQETAQQKAADDAFVAKIARTQSQQ